MSQLPTYPTRHYTVEEYFALDEASETRLEYVEGRIIDMAGGSERHSHIVHNVNGALWTRLRGKPCQGRAGDLRVRFGRRSDYGYPDALIVCGPPLMDPTGRGDTTLLNPRVLIEVLSDSTEG